MRTCNPWICSQTHYRLHYGWCRYSWAHHKQNGLHCFSSDAQKKQVRCDIFLIFLLSSEGKNIFTGFSLRVWNQGSPRLVDLELRDHTGINDLGVCCSKDCFPNSYIYLPLGTKQIKIQSQNWIKLSLHWWYMHQSGLLSLSSESLEHGFGSKKTAKSKSGKTLYLANLLNLNLMIKEQVTDFKMTSIWAQLFLNTQIKVFYLIIPTYNACRVFWLPKIWLWHVNFCSDKLNKTIHLTGFRPPEYTVQCTEGYLLLAPV